MNRVTTTALAFITCVDAQVKFFWQAPKPLPFGSADLWAGGASPQGGLVSSTMFGAAGKLIQADLRGANKIGYSITFGGDATLTFPDDGGPSDLLFTNEEDVSKTALPH